MAMIFCYNCGKQISDKAPVCPHCNAVQEVQGAELQEVKQPMPAEPQFQTTTVMNTTAKKKQNPMMMVVIVLLILLVAAGVVIVGMMADKSDGGTSSVGQATNSWDYQYSEPVAEANSEPESYSVTFYVEVDENLFFSKYDVDVLLDGKSLETIGHGQGKQFEPRMLQKGTHKLTFCKNGDSTVKGETSFEVTEDMTLSYKLECKKNQIKVKRS